MQNFFDVIQNRSGVAVQGALVTVYNSVGAVATIYSDNGVTTKANPTATNIDGEYSFYAANGTYSLAIAATGYTSETRTGVVLFDPSESSANLTGPITSVGNATAIASQTGTGTTFVMSESPTVNNLSYTGTLTGGTGVVNLGSGQLVKDAAGNVGLGVTPSAWSVGLAIEVGGSAAFFGDGITSGYTAGISQNAYFTSVNTWRYRVTGIGSLMYRMTDTSHEWYTAPSGTAGNPITFTQAMTLDAAGNLLVGTTTPASGAQFTVNGSASINGYRIVNEGGFGTFRTPSSMRIATDSNGIDIDAASFAIRFLVASNERMRLDASGNLGLGVVPSAWGSGWRALQTVGGNSFYSDSTVSALASNAIFDGAWKYFNTASAGTYQINRNAHNWFTAPSGTAGNAISFTQAMTLDASGNLLVGKTVINNTVVGNELRADGSTYSTLAASTNATQTLHVFSNGASAYRFYVGLGGTISATSTTITAISDQRLKENIRDLDDGLDVVMALKPRKFDWKDGKGADIKNARGFIAQEFEQVLPDMIEEWKDPAPEGEEPYKAVNANLIPTLVKAIQEQQALITSLIARVAQLESKP